MRKVYFNPIATQDLRNILIGLLTWKKVELNHEQAREYVEDIYQNALNAAQLKYHIPCRYKEHLGYGTHFVRYRRNSRATWYIIYNVSDTHIFIERIVSNYMTTV